MTTTADLIERTRRHLMGGESRDERNRLSAALTADATTLSFEFDQRGIQPGSRLAIGTEELHVWSAQSSSATVERGLGGSTAAVHAEGDVIFVNPKFSAFAILEAINEELIALVGEGLYAVGRYDFTYQNGTDAYDLTGLSTILDVIEVTYDAADGTEQWPRIPRGSWSLRRGMQTAEFSSGLALIVRGYANGGADINVLYRTPFTPLGTLTDDVEDVSGLPASAHDIVPLGAALRLLAGSEVARNFLVQGDTRRADEVPPQARASQGRMLADLRKERISSERARLYAKYPVLT